MAKEKQAQKEDLRLRNREKTGKHERRPIAKKENLKAKREEKFLITPRGGGALRVHLVYPNKYEIGMSSLGFQAVYALFAAQPNVSVERIFIEEEQTGNGGFRTLESGREAAQCDLLAFSVAFETDFLNLLKCLSKSGLLYRDLQEREEQAAKAFPVPLIMAGGTAITLNPEPIADFLDICLLGEAEEFIPELVHALQCGGSRRDILSKLCSIEGSYIPGFYKPEYLESGPLRNCERISSAPDAPKPARRVVRDLAAHKIHSAILTPDTTFKNMFLTEVCRGCETACRFCAASYIYRPVRKRGAAAVAGDVKEGLETTGLIGLVGASVSSHPAVKDLLKEISSKGARASLSSVMAHKIDTELAEALAQNEYETVAIAPETGTERLRFIVGKRVPDAKFFEAAALLGKAGLKRIKLYFMLGLPGERDSDVKAILGLSKEVLCRFNEAGGRARSVALSLNAFVPKPSTPFQWERMESLRSLDKKFKWLTKEAGRTKGIELRIESPRVSLVQALLSKGDRRLGNLLVETITNDHDWKWLLKQAEKERIGDANMVGFYTQRKAPYDEFLPWDHLEFGIEKAILIAENKKAHEEA